MTAATTYRILWPPTAKPDGCGASKDTGGTNEDAIPMIMYGEGTPAGTLWPWTIAPKGSIWLSTNQSDNSDCAWVKYADNDAVADWVAFGGVTGAPQRFETKVFDMDAAANEYDYLFFPGGCEVVAAHLVYTETTDSAGAAAGGISAGTAADGTQVMALQAYEVSKTAGYAKVLTIADGTIAAGGTLVTKNTKVAATDAGKMKVVYYVVLP